jgi:hydrogenase-4 membrane subunit HyfE
MTETTNQLLDNLNALAAGLFLLTAFGIVAMRQVRGCLNLFIVQSLLLAASAALFRSSLPVSASLRRGARECDN